jgi:hypothetical protein
VPRVKEHEGKAVDGFTHKYEDANGARLHYVIGGRGDPVVLLHGWPQTQHVPRGAMILKRSIEYRSNDGEPRFQGSSLR